MENYNKLIQNLISKFSQDSIDEDFDYCFENFRDLITPDNTPQVNDGDYFNYLEALWTKYQDYYKPHFLHKLLNKGYLTFDNSADNYLHIIIPADNYTQQYDSYIADKQKHLSAIEELEVTLSKDKTHYQITYTS